MAATAWRVYRQTKEVIAEGGINFETDSFKLALFSSTSNCGDVALATPQYASLTNEVGTTNTGYTTGGKAIANPSASMSGGTLTFDADDPAAWTAGSANLVHRFAVIYDDTHASKQCICYCIADSTPADVTVTSGNTLTYTFNASGIFTITGAEA